MAAYEWTSNIGFRKVSAQTVGEVCEQLEKTVGISPKNLLDASRDENAPLHNAFDWDNDTAAEKWRLEQARQLITNIRIVMATDTEERETLKERAFVSTPSRQGNYISLDSALRQQDMKDYLLKQAKKDSECFIAKFKRLTELAAVIGAMEEFLKVG